MNSKIYATTIEQSKRLIDAGIPDETADFKYIWNRTIEKQINFFKKKVVKRYHADTRFEPSIGLLSITGDLEIMKDGDPFVNDDNKLETDYTSEGEIIKLRYYDNMPCDAIPSWSLTALFNLLPYGGLDKVSNKYVYRAKDYNGKLVESAVEATVEAVIWFKQNGII